MLTSKLATAAGVRTKTGGAEYAGMNLVIRQPRRFAVGERSAHFDTFFGNYIDRVLNPSIARQKDTEIANRMRQDLQVMGCLTVRKLATAQLKRQWTPSPLDAGGVIARKFERWFDQQYRVTQALMNNLDAILDGIQIQEIVWTVNDDYTYGMERQFDCQNDRFVFSKDGKLCLLTRGNIYYGEQVHPWQFYAHTYGATGGSWNRPYEEARQYWGQGLETFLYPNYYFKTVTLNLMTRWLQRLSGGVFVGRYPFKNPDARSVMEELMNAWQEDEVFAIPSGEEWGYEIHEGTKAPADTFLAVIEYFDKQIAKLILGATLVNDQTDVGSHALGEVQVRNTFGRIVEYDRTGLQETINYSVVPVMGQLNHVPKTLWPRFGFMMDVSEDSTAILEDFAKLQGLGFTISAEMVTEKAGYREAKPGETILSAPMNAMGGLDMGGLGSNAGPGGLSGLNLSSPQGMAKFRAILHRSRSHERGLQRYDLGPSLDGHAHIATLDRYGNGETDRGPDGHGHAVRNWRVVPCGNNGSQHTHELLVQNRDFEQVVRMLSEPAAPQAYSTSRTSAVCDKRVSRMGGDTEEEDLTPPRRVA